MKKKLKTTVVLFTLLASVFISSCDKGVVEKVFEGAKGPYVPYTCTYTIDGITTYTADSINWDVNRLKAFKDSVQVFTVWLPAMSTQAYSLSTNSLFWFENPTTNGIFNCSSGTLNLTNTSDVLSGDFTASGVLYSGSSSSSISANFDNAHKL
jgi:hypothetical protein